MADLAVRQEDFVAWFAQPLPRVRCLRELDWSGNSLPQRILQEFVGFFFASNAIRFLTIDTIFQTKTLGDLRAFVQALPTQELFGLSIGGDRERRFSGHFTEFLDVIGSFNDLSILHIDGQGMTEADASALIMFLERHPNIHEISADDTVLATLESLLNFYGKPELLNLKSSGRPFIDLQRLGAASQFLQSVAAKAAPVPAIVRASYLSSNPPDGRLSVEEMIQFAGLFPNCFESFDVVDPRNLTRPTGGFETRSVCAIRAEARCQSLSALHCEITLDAWATPEYSPSAVADDTTDRVQRPQVAIEPLSQAPEMRALMLELAGPSAAQEEEDFIESDSQGDVVVPPPAGVSTPKAMVPPPAASTTAAKVPVPAAASMTAPSLVAASVTAARVPSPAAASTTAARLPVPVAASMAPSPAATRASPPAAVAGSVVAWQQIDLVGGINPVPRPETAVKRSYSEPVVVQTKPVPAGPQPARPGKQSAKTEPLIWPIPAVGMPVTKVNRSYYEPVVIQQGPRPPTPALLKDPCLKPRPA
jgi:hypothetical protein